MSTQASAAVSATAAATTAFLSREAVTTIVTSMLCYHLALFAAVSAFDTQATEVFSHARSHTADAAVRRRTGSAVHDGVDASLHSHGSHVRPAAGKQLDARHALNDHAWKLGRRTQRFDGSRLSCKMC